ncbi:anti-sigma factor [Bacillus sp. V3-13]|uniref:anti-sigma factor family protein n=1 Tax=Bacillus sp. V3-13 TaxID=2053728 RepID=UPI000C7688CC|nr:anti-sigma factor [Bacillus sp. V3-13]PLR75805.1 anti-sigma factor [Bacillus sp. V3-13]
MKCPEEIVEYMHEYLDDEISAEHEQELRKHLQDCPDCQTHFHELKKAIALVQSTSHIQAPLNFTADVMSRLPKENRKIGIQRWFRHHPFLTAASLFLVLMMGSLFSAWNEEDQQFSVSKQPNLIVENNTVIVPKGEVVEGDVTVKNGNLKIEGEVKGNVTVINGENYLASAGQVTGEIKEVNEMFDWIWYHIKKTAKEVVNIFDGEDKRPLEESG